MYFARVAANIYKGDKHTGQGQVKSVVSDCKVFPLNAHISISKFHGNSGNVIIRIALKKKIICNFNERCGWKGGLKRTERKTILFMKG
jgi:hypothetical protein